MQENDIILEIIDMMNESDSFDFSDETLLFDGWIYEQLPFPLKRLFDLIDKPRSKDISLLTILTILGAIVKNYESLHDETWIGTQLYFYLLGNPGHGKSVAANLKDLGRPYHNYFRNQFEQAEREFNVNALREGRQNSDRPLPKKRFLYVSGDITKSALVNQLKDNQGYGFIFLTEADTLTGAIYNQYGGFKDMLKNGFDGHPFSVSRTKAETGVIEIDSLKLSVLLTSTVNQCFQLIPTSEDGLFSRFMFYVIPPDYNFENVFGKKDITKIEEAKQMIAANFMVAGIQGERNKKVTFEFTKNQSADLYKMFSEIKELVGESQHINLLGSINRMAVIIRKIAMNLSYLRSREINRGQALEKIVCSSLDYKIAKSISCKLLIHLLAVEYLYQKNNFSQRKLAFIPSNADLDAVDKNKNMALKLRANSLRSQGMSFRKISESIFGDNKHPGTIKKWIDALRKKTFPFPETETLYGKKNRSR